MKSLIVAFLILGTTLANAAEVLVLETQLPISRTFATRAFARFYMDQTTGEGFAKITATEERYLDMNPGCRVGPNGQCFPMPPQTMPVIIFEETVKIEDLALVSDKIIYNGAEGEVACGTLGVSRIFKKPTIYLSGKCSLEAKVRGSKLTVNFVTK